MNIYVYTLWCHVTWTIPCPIENESCDPSAVAVFSIVLLIVAGVYGIPWVLRAESRRAEVNIKKSNDVITRLAYISCVGVALDMLPWQLCFFDLTIKNKVYSQSPSPHKNDYYFSLEGPTIFFLTIFI